MSNTKYGIIGSRNFIDKVLFLSKLNEVIALEGTPKLVISGGAKGADALAEEWAKENKIDFEVFLPQYKDFPKKERKFAAPKARNTLIAEYSDIIIAFWDCQSTGTKNTIDKGIALGKRVYIFDVNIINP